VKVGRDDDGHTLGPHWRQATSHVFRKHVTRRPAKQATVWTRFYAMQCNRFFTAAAARQSAAAVASGAAPLTHGVRSLMSIRQDCHYALRYSGSVPWHQDSALTAPEG